MKTTRLSSTTALAAVAFLGLGLGSLHAQTRDYAVSFTTPVTLATDVASWNYSTGASYESGDFGATPVPVFLVRGMSSGSDHAIVTVGAHTGYNVATAGADNANFGFYLLNLDFTDLVVGQGKVVSYSFKIRANDTNNSINPNNWAVNYATGATTAGGISFPNLAQTFAFQDDNTTWTTVSGSFELATGVGSSRGGILINAGTSGSGFTSAGSITLADLSLTVTTVIPEPGTYGLLGGLAGLGWVLVARRRRAGSGGGAAQVG